MITLRHTPLAGLLWIEPVVRTDERGIFLETYHRERYREAGIGLDFVQDNYSRSRKGVFRGFHYQDLTAPMAKLVRCSRGAVLDVVCWDRSDLGSLAPLEHADMEYKCSGYYDPSAEQPIAWNDPEIAAAWPTKTPIVSSKDARGMTLAEYRTRPAFP